jgi:hypothetical protein
MRNMTILVRQQRRLPVDCSPTYKDLEDIRVSEVFTTSEYSCYERVEVDS